MYLKGIKKKDILFILECLKYGKYNYEEKSFKYVCNPDGSYDESYATGIRKKTLDEYSDVIGKLKEAIEK